MKNACFVIPIHPPKFKFGIHCLMSYSKYYDDDHIYLVFSSAEDHAAFERIALGLRYRAIICPPLVSKSPTTEKKFSGMKHVFDTTDFEYIAAIDVDSEFTKQVDYADLFDKFYQQGTLYGNKYDFSPFPILEAPLKFFTNSEAIKIHSFTEGFRAYFWFNDISVYRRNDFLDFLNYIDYNRNAHKLTWFDFDYIIYAYYMIIRNKFRIKPILINGKPLNRHFIEDQKDMDPEEFKQAFEQVKPMWVRKDINSPEMSRTFMNVHVDRRWY